MSLRTFLSVLLLSASSVGAADLAEGPPRLLDSKSLPVKVDPVILQRQFDALNAMPAVTVQYLPRGPVHFLRGDTGIALSPCDRSLTKGDDAHNVVELLADVLLATGTETLIVRETNELDFSRRDVRFDQFIRGIPVMNGRLAIEYEAETGHVTVLSANFLPDRDLPREARISGDDAKHSVENSLAIFEKTAEPDVEFDSAPYLAYYASVFDPTPARLVWVLRGHEHSDQYLYYVDANSGDLLERIKETSDIAATTLRNAAIQRAELQPDPTDVRG